MKSVLNHLTLRTTIGLLIYFSIISTIYGQTEARNLKSNKEIAISYINEVVNNRKTNLIGEIFSPTYVFHEMNGKESYSISDSSLVSFLNYLFKAFPDLHYTIESAIAEDDLVALSLTASGTHEDEFRGYKASFNKVVFKEMFFFRLSNKEIVEGWGVVDVDGVMKQIAKQ
jgi:predicted ester cyclase